MGEGLGYYITLALLLEIVISDLGCAVEGFLDVALFEGPVSRIVIVGPDSGIIVGLELQTYAVLVRNRLAGLLHDLMGLVEGSEQVLDMVSDLVGDHIGVCKVAVCSEGLLHRGEEAEVEIDRLVG